ncbi:MAG: hypothetical protein HQ523_09060 [Lentisphaerae bacterium]|nr:hypothetical protein [Lentisphaerota bacterium]
MAAQRIPMRAGSTLIGSPSTVKLTAARGERKAPPEKRQTAGSRLAEHMPNGDPPNVMLWGDEE